MKGLKLLLLVVILVLSAVTLWRVYDCTCKNKTILAKAPQVSSNICQITLPDPNGNPMPTTSCKAGQLPSAMPNAKLPDGTTVLVCPGNVDIAVPKEWSYKKLQNSVFSVVLPHYQGTSSKIDLTKYPQSLLYIANLLPNKTYELQFDNLKIPVVSNSQGIILFGKNPLPIHLLGYHSITLNLTPNNTPPLSTKIPMVMSPPSTDYYYVNGFTEAHIIVGENTPYFNCEWGNNVLKIIGTYVDTVDDRKTIPITIGNQNMVIKNNFFHM
jgi:hypothetical protein